ncbi:transposase [Paenibacillus apiarius]|uniref:Transposase n=2 Tax=Paenibacillus apiarius TaxID=46240 RepID=A0ABT4DZZ0_9BACL|nr:transposase [Paenibacillus apiarius]MCY9522315.1 transposase [Paenibacillus apiarius]MCY9555094.1 transposase [Paenibacillus apiarius]MCY9558216.1 transposase [Paenibacillus apiarius]MCY9684616.1 transposase [Paenibacillus apiarius]
MSLTFIRGIEKYFLFAEIFLNKFCIMKIVAKAVDEVRTCEQRQTPELKGSSLQTGRSYHLKLALQDLWTTSYILADVYLREWIGLGHPIPNQVHDQLEKYEKTSRGKHLALVPQQD